MKIHAYNAELDDPTKFGSFVTASRGVNSGLKQLNSYSESNEANHILFLEGLDTRKRFERQIPYLIAEYNLMPRFCAEWLKQWSPTCLAISEVSKIAYVNAGYDADKIHVALLGTNPRDWYVEDVEKYPTFTFLTVNASNERSGLDIFPKVFAEWAQDKNVQLIIKDSPEPNEKFHRWLKTFDNQDKIRYIGTPLTQKQLRLLYNFCHVHCYVNRVTGFGQNILDSSLCGLPQIVTHGSAIKEFSLPAYNLHVESTYENVTPDLLNYWECIGIKNNLLHPSQYAGQLITERPEPESIKEKLQYAFDNYLEMKKKNQVWQSYILNNLVWKNTAQKILEILK